MASRSNKQHREYTNKQVRLMAAAANNPEIAKRKGIKRSVAKKFTRHKAETGQLSEAMKEVK